MNSRFTMLAALQLSNRHARPACWFKQRRGCLAVALTVYTNDCGEFRASRLAYSGVSVSGRVVIPAAIEGATGAEAYTEVLLYRPGTIKQGGGFAEMIDGRFELKNALPRQDTLMPLTRSSGGGAAEGKPVSATMRQVEAGDQDVNEFSLELEPWRDVRRLHRRPPPAPFMQLGTVP
jgi:hypothetical protein